MRIEQLIQFGIVNIHKLAGPTSHEVAEYVRKILHAEKTGHSGTLDPGVTGCLPVALGNASRILELMLKYGKEYVCVMELHADHDEKEIRKILMSFLGEIEQLPPVKSSVKRALRKRTIYELEILEIRKRKVLFRVSCQAGTYIRKLVHDVGLKMGSGAHMAELRRTKAGMFDESSLVTLNDLRDAYELWREGRETHNKKEEEKGEKLLRSYIQEIEVTTTDLPKSVVNDTGRKKVMHGPALRGTDILNYEKGKKDDTVAVMDMIDGEQKLIALGIYVRDSRYLKIKKEHIAITIFKVFTRPEYVTKDISS